MKYAIHVGEVRNVYRLTSWTNLPAQNLFSVSSKLIKPDPKEDLNGDELAVIHISSSDEAGYSGKEGQPLVKMIWIILPFTFIYAPLISTVHFSLHVC